MTMEERLDAIYAALLTASSSNALAFDLAMEYLRKGREDILRPILLFW